MTGPLRVGTAERTAAMAALDEHLAAGRLGVEEYADRSAIAANAAVTSEIAALFTDLPAPHPDLPGVPLLPPTTATPVVPTPTQQLPVVRAAEPAARSVLAVWGPRALALTPLVAVALFFLTGTWLWFLIIPVAGVLYGTGTGRGRDRRRDRTRGP